MNMHKIIAGAAIVCFIACGGGSLRCTGPAFAIAQEDWKAEFANICSKTENPMPLSADELRSLIDRCDRLKPRIEQLEDSAQKVYLKRLKMCRDLFVFVLESKSK